MNAVPGGEYCRNEKRYGTDSLVEVQVRARIDLAKDDGVGETRLKTEYIGPQLSSRASSFNALPPMFCHTSVPYVK